MLRRLKAYRTANNSVVAEPSVQDFFKKQCIGIYSEEISTAQKDALNGFKIYIERVRSSYFYQLRLTAFILPLEWEALQLHDLRRRGGSQAPSRVRDPLSQEGNHQETPSKTVSAALWTLTFSIIREENLEKILKQQKLARTKESNEIYRDKHKDILDNKS